MRSDRGFTLLELTVVIVLIGAGLAIVLPDVGGEQGLPLHRRCEVCGRCRHGRVCACPPGRERREGPERPRAGGAPRRWF